MAEPVIVTVHYTPPGAPDADSLHLELHAQSGARLTLQLGAHHRPPTPSADIPAQPQPADPPPPPASPHDWDLPGLPADCAPGRTPELLTEAQAAARLRYGYDQGWTQRRIGAFAGRATGTVHKHVKRFRAERKSETGA